MRVVTAFALGALAGLAGAAALAADPPPARVVAQQDAPLRTAPSGKARVWTLADAAHGSRSAFLGLLEMEPGAAVAEHRDPTEEYLYVLEGGGTITIDGTAFTIRPGMAVFMPADALVSFQASVHGRTRVVQVFAPPGPEAKYEAWK